MKTLKKGWLKEYLDFRKDLLEDNSINTNVLYSDYSFYQTLQPTSMLFGSRPAATGYDQSKLKGKDKLKIILAESLISSALLYNHTPITNPEDFSSAIIKTLNSISRFYNTVFPELEESEREQTSLKNHPIDLAEKILERRIENTINHEHNFWLSSFHNSLLFLDVLIFGQWLHTNVDNLATDFFRKRHEALRFSVVKVIAVAAHANRSIEFEEKKLVELFIDSTDLPTKKKKEALTIFYKNADVSKLNLSSENSWVLKKFFMEMAILTVWADQKVEKKEENFLRRFSEYLGFSDNDLQNSIAAIEGFILEYWEQLEYLQDRKDYQVVSSHFVKRISLIVEKNKTRLQTQIKESKELNKLLKKIRSKRLTKNEEEKMRILLLSALQTVPTFVIISLPQRFLTLPLLLKILPKNIIKK